MVPAIETAPAAEIVFSQADVELDAVTAPTSVRFLSPHWADKHKQNVWTPESCCNNSLNFVFWIVPLIISLAVWWDFRSGIR